jgi:hypothetical protein
MAKMGRPLSENPKQNRVSVRFDDEDYAKLKQYAAKHNLSIAQTVREGAIKLATQDR